CKRPCCNRFPHRSSEGRFDCNWRAIGRGSSLERQAFRQDVAPRTFLAGFAREEDDPRGAQHRNASTAISSPHRTMRYGALTAFLASNSVHGALLAHVTARANAT